MLYYTIHISLYTATPRPRSNLGSRRLLASPHETGVRQPTTPLVISVFVTSSFEEYATLMDTGVTAALVLILPLLATVLTAVCVEMTIDYNGNKTLGAHTSVELGLGRTPRPPTASTLSAVELEFSQPVTSSANNGNGHSTKDSQFDAISDFNSITITDNHLQVESRMTRSASAIPEERFDNIYADSGTQEGPIPTVEDYANNQHLLITSHLLRFKHQLCQRMSIAVTIMTAVGYAAIGLSLSTVKWTVVTASRHLDTTEFLFVLSRTLLALACPILGLAGCTVLGIALMYVSSGQIDGKQLISTLLPTVQLARRVSKSDEVPKQSGKYYWMFASTTCIAINPPRGGRDQLRHYLDTTPATWMLMVVIYMSALVAANYLVAFGVVVREDFIPTAEDCEDNIWHCYKHIDSLQGKSVDCNVYVLANESSVLPLDDDLICYRFGSLKELETIAESLAGSVAVYLISAYMTPYLIRGMLMLEKVKKTKLWALIPTTLGGIGFLTTIGIMVVYPTSLLLLQACIFCLCILAVGVLVGCSRTQLVLTAPEIQPSVIVDMDSKLITKIEMMLEEQALAES